MVLCKQPEVRYKRFIFDFVNPPFGVFVLILLLANCMHLYGVPVE